MLDFKNYHIEGLLVDRHSDNFYFCKKFNNAHDESIVIITKKNIFETTLISFKNDDVSRYSLALHSKYMLYILKKKHYIDQINCETENTMHFRSLPDTAHNVLTIDQKENRTYWIDRSNSSHLDISHKNPNVINGAEWFWVDLPVKNVTTFHIHERLGILYWR